MRVMKFSAVGAIGIVVQVAVLAGLAHLHLHYLVATACGVEAAVLHNFCWHQHFTWRDRGVCSVWSRLARFHLSNAAISLVGNLALMRVLVGAFRIQVIAANAVALPSALSPIILQVNTGCLRRVSTQSARHCSVRRVWPVAHQY